MPTIPVNFFITPFADHGNVEGVTWSCELAGSALEVANKIWKSSEIQFHAKGQVCSIDTPCDVSKGLRTHDQMMLDIITARHPATTMVNIFLIERVPGLIAGGASYMNSKPESACFVQNFGEPTATGRMLAHELGHLLNLDHVNIDYQKELKATMLIDNLMVAGLSTGTKLFPKQRDKARGSQLVKKFAG